VKIHIFITKLQENILFRLRIKNNLQKKEYIASNYIGEVYD